MANHSISFPTLGPRHGKERDFGGDVQVGANGDLLLSRRVRR